LRYDDAMSDSSEQHKPKPQPSSAGGPPRPPKKTAEGLADDDESPERQLQRATKMLEALLRRVEEIKRKKK
jgi:hypothetical protein